MIIFRSLLDIPASYITRIRIFKGIMFENVETFPAEILSWYLKICNGGLFIFYKVGDGIVGFRG